MPQEDAPLYSRGKYRLDWDRKRDGTLRSPFIQIVWYDDAAGRNRSRSTGTAEIGPAEDALDALYLERERGLTVCHACGRPMDGSTAHLVTVAISDYLIARRERASFESIRPRLAHVLDFLDATTRTGLACSDLDATLIDEFRRWSAKQPVITGTVNQKSRDRAPGTTEASVSTLAAAINFAYDRGDTPFRAKFAALPPSAVSRTPTYRASIEMLAAMFRYCIDPQAPTGVVWSDKMRGRQKLHRRNLLRFLQASVATWARPDAVLDISTAPERDQWILQAKVLQLNQKGRAQTKKYRPAVPVPERFARLLDGTNGFFIPAASIRKAFEAMQDALGLPRDRETGTKLVRRSVAQIARKRIGEERWRQGEIMLGHAKASTSDLYALFDPANLGLALEVTSGIISEIEALAPGAYSPLHTGTAPDLRLAAAGPQKGKIA
ncbi:MAG: hypothetical protein KGL44_05465 [Sphingomonadales bacterium]|nr:hypothetical protein [Sphingomonadales bacterium]